MQVSSLNDRVVCRCSEDGEYLTRECLAEEGDRPASKESFEEFDNYDRNRHILSLLSDQSNAEVTFQGLKRKLGWHQEILSRTLKRLEKDGAVAKTPLGAYKLNFKEKISNGTNQLGRLQDDVTPVTQLWLPKDLNSDVLAAKLKNTWFGAWRWYGYGEEGAEKILTWLSEDGSVRVNLRIVDSVMFIEAGPVGSAGTDGCIHAGYELLGHVLRLYKSGLAELRGLLQPN